MPSFYATIDRFEDDDLAVLELAAGITVDVPRAWLPPQASEGDVLRMRVRTTSASGASSLLYFVIDVEATAERRNQVQDLRSRLPKGPEGDLDL